MQFLYISVSDTMNLFQIQTVTILHAHYPNIGGGDYWNIGSRGGPGTPVHPLATTPKAIMTCSTVKLA